MLLFKEIFRRNIAARQGHAGATGVAAEVVERDEDWEQWKDSVFTDDFDDSTQSAPVPLYTRSSQPEDRAASRQAP